MPTLIVMPSLGMTMEEGTVTAWPRQPGERVEKGEVAVIIETEKSEAEVEATASGFLRHIYVPVGETVACGTPLALLTETEDEPFDAEGLRRAVRPAATGARAMQRERRDESAAEIAASSAARSLRPATTPRARRLARELGVDVTSVPGSGPGGRITEQDVREWGERQQRRVEVEDGVFLELVAAGEGKEEGEIVLLLPGFGTDASLYSPIGAGLGSDFRPVAVQPRGFGASDGPEVGDDGRADELYGVERYGADAAAVAGALSEQPLHVVGTSLGAVAALELALREPARVASLTLLAPFLAPSSRLLAVLDSWCALVREAPPRVAARALLPWLFGDAVLGDAGARERMERGLADLVARCRPEALEHWAQGLRAWPGLQAEDLRQVEIPTLVLFGEADLLAPADPLAWQLAASFEVRTLAGAGHALPLEAAPAVIEAVLGHVATARR